MFFISFEKRFKDKKPNGEISLFVFFYIKENGLKI